MSHSTRRDFVKTTSLAAVTGALAPFTVSARSEEPKAPGDLNGWLKDAIARHKIPGASMAIYHDGAIVSAAAGITNSTTRVPVDTRTVMHIGSITKVLNTTLMMQMVDDGLVELDAPVVEYLPNWRVADEAATRAITVKMLLNHTSGIDGELLPDHGPDRERIEDAIPRFASMRQIHRPGKDTSYCNTASTTAGYLVQRMRGKSWYTIIEEFLFKRLGLEHSIVQPADALLHRNTVGHFLDPETGEFKRTSHAFLPQSFAPAGATAMLSATDLVTFAAAHLRDGLGLNGERLLSAQSAQLMRFTTSKLKGYGIVREFGLGWMLLHGNQIGHGGGGPGILSGLTAAPEKGYAIAVLTNASHGNVLVEDATNTWGERIADIKPFETPSYSFTDQSVDLSRYLGVYSGIAAKHEIVEHQGGLGYAVTASGKYYDSVSLERSKVTAIKPVADDAFAFATPGATSGQAIVSFVNPGSDGLPRHLAMGGRLYRRQI